MFFETELENWPLASFRSQLMMDINPLSGVQKKRCIWSPNEEMRRLQKSLVTYLRSLGIELPSSTGAVPGKSVVDHINRHRLQDKSFPRYFYHLDIANAYGGVDITKLSEVVDLYENGGGGKEILAFLERFCESRDGGLIVGSPSSPDLFNIYCEVVIDQEMRRLCQRYGMTYTRYLDDILLSSTEVIGNRKRKAIRSVVESARFKTNHKKARVIDLSLGPVNINGVGLDQCGRIFLPIRVAKRINGLLHRAINKGDVSPQVVGGVIGLFMSISNKQGGSSLEKDIWRKIHIWRSRRRRARRYPDEFLDLPC